MSDRLPPGPEVVFELSSGSILTVGRPGETLLAAARRARVPLAASCGGRGTCGTCAVRVVDGALSEPSALEKAGLRRAGSDVRLACLALVEGSVRVRPVVQVPGVRSPSLGDTRATSYGAVDVGTSVIAAFVEGERCSGRGSLVNPQVSWGEDVASRMAAAPCCLEELRAAAMRGVEEALGLAAAGAEACALPARVVVAANTVMAHLLLGEDVSALAEAPYVPAYSGIRRATLAHTDSSAIRLTVLPHLGGFVGGDALAGSIAAGLHVRNGPEMLVDVGTNAEVVVSHGDAIVAASAAAGPAFAGGGISRGGPALEGAITSLEWVGERLEVTGTIGEMEPRWLAGSAAVEAIVALLQSGHLDRSGLLKGRGPLSGRFHRRGDVLAVQVLGEVGGREGGERRGRQGGGEAFGAQGDVEPGEPDVYLTQLDVRQIQLAKAAVRVAADMVLEEAGLRWQDVERVHLTGTFGLNLRPPSLESIGLLPPGVAARSVSLTDGALAGALLVARDERLEGVAEDIACRAKVLDLPSYPGFRDRLMSALALG